MTLDGDGMLAPRAVEAPVDGKHADAAGVALVGPAGGGDTPVAAPPPVPRVPALDVARGDTSSSSSAPPADERCGPVDCDSAARQLQQPTHEALGAARVGAGALAVATDPPHVEGNQHLFQCVEPHSRSSVSMRSASTAAAATPMSVYASDSGAATPCSSSGGVSMAGSSSDMMTMSL
jgi:hypothetical protein